MIFDTHAHYYDDAFDPDRDALLSSLPERGVALVVCPGCDLESSEQSIALAEQYPFLYAAAGYHPENLEGVDLADVDQIKALCAHQKVVAVGEIGLDYYWDEAPRDVQKEWFVRQLELAWEMSLPVIIHSRDAAADTLQIMQSHARGLMGVIHCFSYSKELAREYVKMGFFIGVGGVVTFKNGRRLKEVVEDIPLSSIVLETDCPYLAPVPNRGKRNSSLNLPYVVKEIAEIKGISCEEVMAQTEKNAKILYGMRD